MRILLLLMFLIQFLPSSIAQDDLRQNIKGQVVDQDTGLPLIGATIVILGTEPIKGTVSDENGYFLFEKIEIGRYDLACFYIGYLDIGQSNLLLTSGKELVIKFNMQESILVGEEVTVTATKDSDVKTSGLATVSIQEFNSELASRFSGTRNDVSRMASGFAGVVANDDSRNDIVIRGNSPSGLLWKLDGIDIPNPSHFGALGATGGPVSMLNNNMLSNSIFLTGAFPANYGNALSGVFDLSVRKGNQDKFEGTGQISFNGFEIGLEGPLSKKSKASYLVNYRYSVIALFSKIFGGNGGGTGTGDAIPFYDDLSFKVNIPTERFGTFSLVGLGGKSEISFLSDLEETDNPNLFSDSKQNLYYETNMGVVALNNRHYYNNQSSGNLSLSMTTSGVSSSVDEINDDFMEVPVFRDDSRINRVRMSYDYRNKLNAKNSIFAGINTNNITLNLKDSVRVSLDSDEWETLRSFEGNAFLTQAYFQWQYRFTDQLVVNTGLFSQWFSLNDTYAFEPRVSLKYSVNPKLNFTFGAGRHSKIQDLQLYFLRTEEGERAFETNKELKMTTSNQVVAGFDYALAKGWSTKVEAYFQALDNVPIESKLSTYSALNDGADFGIPSRDSLINEGTGRNYGLEFTLEKTFSKGFYLMSTVSLFNSTYVASDKVRRSTAFNGRYVANLLAGKEFEINKKYSFGISTRLTAAGGRAVTPINLEQSILEDEEVRLEKDAYSDRLSDYFRTDLKLFVRKNGKKMTQEFSIDMQNLFDNQNIFDRNYDSFKKEIVDTYQLGRYPVIDYRVTF